MGGRMGARGSGTSGAIAGSALAPANVVGHRRPAHDLLTPGCRPDVVSINERVIHGSAETALGQIVGAYRSPMTTLLGPGHPRPDTAHSHAMTRPDMAGIWTLVFTDEETAASIPPIAIR